MALITCKDVSFAYDRGVVCEGFNFSVGQGDYLCIVGENGAGKSTLMKGLLGLKAPASGTITLGDGLRPNQIGYLPQQTAAQKDFPASVFEVALSGRLASRGLRPFYTKQDRKATLEHLEQLGILSLKDACYRELSGGQQQRVLLARALNATGKMLLLDEPVAGLDPVAMHELYHMISHINREMGITVIMVSHDVKCAADQADLILHLKGKQLFFGPTQEYRNTPEGKRFLGDEPSQE